MSSERRRKGQRKKKTGVSKRRVGAIRVGAPPAPLDDPERLSCSTMAVAPSNEAQRRKLRGTCFWAGGPGGRPAGLQPGEVEPGEESVGETRPCGEVADRLERALHGGDVISTSARIGPIAGRFLEIPPPRTEWPILSDEGRWGR